LRRYIQQFTTVLLTEEQLSSAVANLLRIKRNGLTLDDHLRSLRHAATVQIQPPWENGVKHTFDVGAMSASAKMTQSNRQSNIHRNSNSLVKIGPLSRCKFSSVLGDYPRHPADKFRPEHAAHLMQLGGLAEPESRITIWTAFVSR
jgi:hypothetical protein